MKFILLTFITFLIASVNAQTIDLYQPLGIETINITSQKSGLKNLQITADTILINGYSANLTNVNITFEYDNASSQINFGQNYSLIKINDYEYTFVNNQNRKSIDIRTPYQNNSSLDGTSLNVEEKVRFILMATLLNFTKDFNSNTYASSGKLAPGGVKKCGTWEVTAYGHSQTGSMLNAVQQAQAFENSNANCGQSGGTSTSCIAGQHFCFTSYTYHCSCSVTIPFIGLGW